MVSYLFSLMRRFELCYPLDASEERWLVPQLLDPFQPELGSEWRARDSTRLRYRYKVLPEGLLPRFIVRTHPHSEGELRWRNGVVLRLDSDSGEETMSASALVRAEPVDNLVSVIVVGHPIERLRLVKLVRSHFAAMHADLRSLNPREEVEVAGHPDVFKSVSVLEADERKGAWTTIETDEGSLEIDKTEELNRISAPAARDPERPRVKVFLCYSHRDAALRDVFRSNLDVLRMDGLVTWWFDGQISPSSEWDKEIRRELEESDIVLLMVSTPFLASPYIRGVELARAVQRRATGDAEIGVVLLEKDCAWQGNRTVPTRSEGENLTFSLDMYQSLLPEGRAVRGSGRHQSAFNQVEKGLRVMIEAVLERRRRQGRRVAAWLDEQEFEAVRKDLQ
jgi:internalin A